MKSSKGERCPKCGKNELFVIPSAGSRLLGEPKKCRICGFAIDPAKGKTITDTLKK